MLNFMKETQAGGAYKMYIKPELEIVDVNDEDIIRTSLSLEGEGGEIDLGKLGDLEWF